VGNLGHAARVALIALVAFASACVGDEMSPGDGVGGLAEAGDGPADAGTEERCSEAESECPPEPSRDDGLGVALPSATVAAPVVEPSATARTVDCLGQSELDFETDADGAAVAAGTYLEDLWTGCGLRIACADRRGDDRSCIAFDSAAPTGGDDDLGTPNEAFGGPGRGGAGGPGKPGENGVAQGQVAIIAERTSDRDGDGRVDAPDDLSSGGTITFRFDEPVDLDSVTVIDVDTDEDDAAVVVGLADEPEPVVLPLAPLGNNSVQRLILDLVGVTALTVDLDGSGAVARVALRCDAPGTFYPDLDGDGFGDATSAPVPVCSPADELVADNALDCDDGDPAVNPMATDVPDGAFVDANCDGIDGDPDALLFVAPDGDDAAPGTQEQPMRTLQAAISAAASRGRDVAALEGAYDPGVVPSSRGVIRLRDGVSVFGGYFRVGAGPWARGPGHRASLEVTPEVSNVATIGVEAQGLFRPTVFAHVDVVVGDAARPGGTVVGLLARRAPGLTGGLRRRRRRRAGHGLLSSLSQGS